MFSKEQHMYVVQIAMFFLVTSFFRCNAMQLSQSQYWERCNKNSQVIFAQVTGGQANSVIVHQMAINDFHYNPNYISIRKNYR